MYIGIQDLQVSSMSPCFSPQLCTLRLEMILLFIPTPLSMSNLPGRQPGYFEDAVSDNAKMLLSILAQKACGLPQKV